MSFPAKAASINRRRSSSLTNRGDIMLPWDKFHNWIHCICIVTFDLELGQALELVFPRHAKLSEKEKSNICYLAFPDSNSGCMGDTRFYFRIRCNSPFDNKFLDFCTNYNQTAPVALSIDSGFYFGYVYFRQVKDKSLPRGYFQKSVVILTKLPLVKLFSHVIDVIAPEFFDTGLPGLEAACNDIDHWPLPVPGSTLNLPLMGTVIQVRLPSRSDKPDCVEVFSQPRDKMFASTFILASVYEPNFFESLSPIFSHLHLLWELVLVCEPLAIMASSPSICSNVVYCLINLIYPLQYCCDYRPFFTIHDTEFKEFTSKTTQPPNLIIGVTNPFFAKTLENWPNVVRIGDTFTSTKSSPLAKHKVKKGGDLKTLDSKPGIYTRYKTFLSKDKAMIKRLIKGIQARRPSEAQSAIIKRHFLEMTQSFLIPLERYIASLMPLQKNISPWKSAPTVRDFNCEEFVSTLENSGPQLTSCVKGDWIGLYRRFFRSENFLCWLKQRQQEVNYKLQLLHLEILCTSTIYDTLGTKQEVELVDLVLKLREKMAFVEQNSDKISQDLKNRLLIHYETVLNSLREDLKLVLMKPATQNMAHCTQSKRISVEL